VGGLIMRYLFVILLLIILCIDYSFLLFLNLLTW